MPSVQPATEPPDDPERARDPVALGRLVGWQAAAMSHARLAASAHALAGAIAADLGCAQVAIGLSVRHHARLIALAPRAEPLPAGPAARELEAALDECMDQRAVIRVPEPPGARPRITLAHAALVQQPSAVWSAACSLPLESGGRTVGAITLGWHDPRAAAALDPETLAHQLALLAPWLDLLARHERPLPARAMAAARARWRASAWARRAAWVGVAVLAGAWLLWPGAREVGGRARLEGRGERVVTAPADGFLQRVWVRPGDRVRPGDALLELAPQELEADVRRLEAELAQHQGAHLAALARADRAQAGLHLARMQEVQARLAQTGRELGRTRLEAPAEALVLDGDLTRAVGLPVRRGDTLMRLAPVQPPRVVVRVDERDIDGVRPGQPGRLALSALPWDDLPFTVVRVEPMARSVDGASVFEVEARLTGPDETASAALRPGLTGVARIEVGRGARLPALAGRLRDGLRLALWRWTG